MKFSEMNYVRPDVAALKEQLAGLTRQLEQAQTYDEAKAAFLEEEKLSRSLSTMNNLAYVRHSIDTRSTASSGPGPCSAANSARSLPRSTAS